MTRCETPVPRMTEGLTHQNGQGAIVKGKNWVIAADVGLPYPRVRIPKLFQWESPFAGCALMMHAKEGRFSPYRSRPGQCHATLHPLYLPNHCFLSLLRPCLRFAGSSACSLHQLSNVARFSPRTLGASLDVARAQDSSKLFDFKAPHSRSTFSN